MLHRLHERKYKYFEEVNEGVIKQIPVNNTGTVLSVLDVGCGCGALGHAIKEKGYEVWGIENEHDALERAHPCLNRVIGVDLTEMNTIKDHIKDKKFDYVVFSDVLEHVYDPFGIIIEYAKFLKHNGKIIISVPNIAVWEARLKLWFGIFDYQESGVMDMTHIRFFTFKTATELLKNAHVKNIKVDYTPYMVRCLLPIIKKNVKERKDIAHSRAYHFYMKWIYPIEYYGGYFFKRLFAFRIILVGEKGEDMC
jgi:2-polyprenyl-3-methyl-5-hydroxy-6-metoxy-1,4-benzoquinol methylase